MTKATPTIPATFTVVAATLRLLGGNRTRDILATWLKQRTISMRQYSEFHAQTVEHDRGIWDGRTF